LRSLADQLGNFIDTINDGPTALHPSLFSGPVDRVMLGLKAHANTINHSRLVALEQTFPLTRDHLGEAAFHQIGRDFIETTPAKACDANRLGETFAEFMRANVKCAAASDLAGIEWAWLESYHAPDLPPMLLSDLSGVDQAELLNMRVAPHPSARIIRLAAPISASLTELAGQFPDALLALRSDIEVELIPLNSIGVAVLNAACNKNANVGNLLAAAIEHGPDTDPLAPITMLIGAGALVKVALVKTEQS
jgi:hypothetical protein